MIEEQLSPTISFEEFVFKNFDKHVETDYEIFNKNQTNKKYCTDKLFIAEILDHTKYYNSNYIPNNFCIHDRIKFLAKEYYDTKIATFK